MKDTYHTVEIWHDANGYHALGKRNDLLTGNLYSGDAIAFNMEFAVNLSKLPHDTTVTLEQVEARFDISEVEYVDGVKEIHIDTVKL